jgi:hypothetical protein
VTPKAVLKAILAALVAAAVALYAGDFAWFEYRMQNAKPNDPLETMTFYYATDIKGGKVEVFDDQPQTAICVHSIFPHGGYKPCWRFGPSGIVRISLMMPRRQPGRARHPVAMVHHVADFSGSKPPRVREIQILSYQKSRLVLRGFPNLVICMPGETLVVEGMNIVSKVFQQGCEPEGKVLVQLDIHLM